MNSNNIEQSVVKLETPLSFGSVCSGIEAASPQALETALRAQAEQ